jgi:hypothetical protein
MTKAALVGALARSVLAARPSETDALSAEEVAAQAAATLGWPWRWLGPMARRFVKAQAGVVRFRHRDAVRFLLGEPGFQRHWRRMSVAEWLHEPPRMQPVPAAAGWDVPAIETADDLAAWLGVSTSDLAWFANLKGLGFGPLDHYHCHVAVKRIIEAPKPRLKALQRRILAGILEKIPAHPAAHGFVKGRSIVSFVTPHTGRRAILKMDLTDFFPSIPAVRVQALFRTMGYPETVADLLGGICTNSIRGAKDDLYRRPHLPQGAPSSPAIANLCLYRLDCRLAGLARALGLEYTRYADDLAVSGDFDFDKLSIHIAVIAQEEGFRVHHRKTRVMRQGVRQRLAGLTANEKPNVIRADFDLLKAILTNCVRFGPASQNREGHPAFRAHLEGRLGFVESINAAKGSRLRRIWERIVWQ